MAAIDLVAWDFGDTLVHERFMRIAPAGVPAWEAVYDRYFDEHPEFQDRWMLGRASMIEMIPWLAEHTGMAAADVGRHLRTVWTQIEWFDSSRRWVEALQGRLPQAVVTVNPFEFSGISAACGLDPLVDVIVTSADIAQRGKPPMARIARDLLRLSVGLETTLLIDNKADNVDEFRDAGGQAILFDPADPDALDPAMTALFG